MELGPNSAFAVHSQGAALQDDHTTVSQGISVPQKPVLQAQEANSATCSSVTVCWKVSEGGVISCVHVCGKTEAQEATSEEHKVTTKENCCTLEDLVPDSSYDVWVTEESEAEASPPSEKMTFLTARNLSRLGGVRMVISTKPCSVLWDSATIRWTAACPAAVETYTLEYCQQGGSEGEGLRFIAGIKGCEQNVSLHPKRRTCSMSKL
ncbi:cardiomyopathy-associated protein 5-like [Scleropages formosus]|uniref:cardiomyopathy-associated protein 5-like n=1 Tax=Scleropages formosus TaxID=113540 RepID=UPI0010FACC8D|nr:cardiomyopathy-associated protein 5-like [Scleropages formosus]